MHYFLRKLPSWLLLLYAAAFAVAARAAHVDSKELGYPLLFLWLGALSSVAATAAVVCFALRIRNRFLRGLLRAFFPVAVVALLWGVLLDATVPQDYSLLISGPSWVVDLLLVAGFVFPAYAIYFFYAYAADA